MRLSPRSLFGRLTLILFVGLLAVQAASFALIWHERERFTEKGGAMHAMLPMIHWVDTLARATPEERVAIAQFARRGGFQLDFVASAGYPAEGWREHVVSRVLDRAVPGCRVLGVRFDPPHDDWRHVLREPAGEQRVTVSLLLPDGKPVSLARSWRSEGLVAPAWRWLFELLVRLGLVLALALVAVRWAMRPLQQMSEAAEELGRDPRRPPLVLRGSREVERAAAALNRMQARLNAQLDGRSQMLAALSHDLRTPLARVRLRSESVGDADLRDKLVRDVDEMQRLLHSTLQFMRGSQPEESQRLELKEFLESLVADYADAGQPVRLLASQQIQLRTGPLTLRRCLSNLIDNAVRYGGSAELRLALVGGWARIEVLDHGPGIPEHELDKVFEPYYRLEPSRSRASGGAGLGLASARSGAQALGAELRLETAPSGGLLAVLMLPLEIVAPTSPVVQ